MEEDNREGDDEGNQRTRTRHWFLTRMVTYHPLRWARRTHRQGVTSEVWDGGSQWNCRQELPLVTSITHETQRRSDRGCESKDYGCHRKSWNISTTTSETGETNVRLVCWDVWNRLNCWIEFGKFKTQLWSLLIHLWGLVSRVGRWAGLVWSKDGVCSAERWYEKKG